MCNCACFLFHIHVHPCTSQSLHKHPEKCFNHLLHTAHWTQWKPRRATTIASVTTNDFHLHVQDILANREVLITVFGCGSGVFAECEDCFLISVCAKLQSCRGDLLLNYIYSKAHKRRSQRLLSTLVVNSIPFHLWWKQLKNRLFFTLWQIVVWWSLTHSTEHSITTLSCAVEASNSVGMLQCKHSVGMEKFFYCRHQTHRHSIHTKKSSE